MVKKLIKYDLMAFAKVMLPIEIALLGVAALYRFVSLFENESTAYSIFNVSTIIILVIASLTALLMTTIYSMVRFYKNLYTQEGYLSFTLPVTPSAHIVSKLVVSFIFDIVTLVTVFVSFCIATAGDVLTECFKAGGYLFSKIAEKIGGQTPLYIVEFIVMLIVYILAFHLLTYMCISIGQCANKHKVLLAVGIYFAVYTAKQIAGTIFIAVGVSTNLFIDIENFVVNNLRLSAHLGMIGFTFLELILGSVYFFVTKNLMKKKLNLE